MTLPTTQGNPVCNLVEVERHESFTFRRLKVIAVHRGDGINAQLSHASPAQHSRTDSRVNRKNAVEL